MGDTNGDSSVPPSVNPQPLDARAASESPISTSLGGVNAQGNDTGADDSTIPPVEPRRPRKGSRSKRDAYDNTAKLSTAKNLGPHIDSAIQQFSQWQTRRIVNGVIASRGINPSSIQYTVPQLRLEPFPCDLDASMCVVRLTPGQAIAYHGHDLGISTIEALVEWLHDHPIIFGLLGASASIAQVAFAAHESASIVGAEVARAIDNQQREANAASAAQHAGSPIPTANAPTQNGNGFHVENERGEPV